MRFLLPVLFLALWPGMSDGDVPGFLPGDRALFEAHNCYPYNGFWKDRIDRALKSPPPIAIEVDLRWQTAPDRNGGELIVAHDETPPGRAPSLRDYVFERLRPKVEAALVSGDKRHWPLYTLNMNDMRGGTPEMYAALWALATEHEAWLCTAIKGESDAVTPMTPGPVLLLSNGGLQATRTFYDAVPVDGTLRIFGSGDANSNATNFRRWINYSWRAVEAEGQSRAGAWAPEDAARLESLVRNAHERGYWIRFYSLNGHGPLAVPQYGWSQAYNFGSLDAVKQRWRAAYEAGVDFIATDQYEEASSFFNALRE
jgi:hypothetical protein